MPSLRNIIGYLIVCLSLTFCFSLVSNSVNAQPRIMGGIPAETGEAGYTLIVYSINNSDGTTNKCSGTLVTTTWVVTAAHCVTNVKSVTVNPAASYGYTYKANRFPISAILAIQSLII